MHGDTKFLGFGNRDTGNICMDKRRQNYCTVIKSLQCTQVPQHRMAVSCLLKNATSYSSKPTYFKYFISCQWHKKAKPINMKHTCSKVHNKTYPLSEYKTPQKFLIESVSTAVDFSPPPFNYCLAIGKPQLYLFCLFVRDILLF